MRKGFTLIELFVVALIILILVVAVCPFVFSGCAGSGYGYYAERTATIEVIRLYAVPGQNGTSYRCYAKILETDDGELPAETTFEITDSFLKGQYMSADLFGRLREGGRYDVVFYGVRRGFLSLFPIIIEVNAARGD
jgi:prepilin-type N-terminal cleavage/methylation domain-containing protein